MTDISRIKLPSGNYYELKDAVARQAIAAGIQFHMAWDGKSTPVPANIPAGVKVVYNEQEYTGTLAATAAEPGFYLVYSKTQVGVADVFDEYHVINVDGVKQWEKFGDTHIDLSMFGELAFKDSVSLTKGDGADVLGKGTTVTAAPSAVTFSGGSKDEALGVNATFTTTVTASKKKIKATAAGAAVQASGTDSFVKSIAGMKKKLVVDTVHDTPSLTKKRLAKIDIPNVTGSADVSIPNVTGNESVDVPVVASNVQKTIPNVTSVGQASTFAFAMGTGDDAETLVISGANSVAPTLGTAITATDTAFGENVEASKVTLGTALAASKVTLGTAIKAASGALAESGDGAEVGIAIVAGDEKNIATGEINTNGEGAEIVYDLDEPTTGDAVTGVEMSAQPTITLAVDANGDVEVADGIASAGTVVNAADKVEAITALGTGQAAAQTITVGENDQVKVAKYADLEVSVQ